MRGARPTDEFEAVRRSLGERNDAMENVSADERDHPPLRRITDASIEPFGRAHLDGLIALIAAEGWTEYREDPEQTYRR